MLFFWTLYSLKDLKKIYHSFHKKTLSSQTAKLFNIDSNNKYFLSTKSAY